VQKNITQHMLGAFLVGLLLLAPSVRAEIPNFHEVDDRFFRGGQPDEEDFKALKTLGFKTIISLRNNPEAIRWEQEIVEANGMYFVSIPLTWKKSPTDGQARLFIDILSQPERRPVFVHCREGRDRAGAMVALYRVVFQGVSPDLAFQEAKALGFREAAIPLKRFMLTRTGNFAKTKPQTILNPPPFIVEFLFYGFEGLVLLLGLATGTICLRNPELAIHIQKYLYALINWQMQPISLEKELRNTRVLGAILMGVTFLLVIVLYLFSI